MTSQPKLLRVGTVVTYLSGLPNECAVITAVGPTWYALRVNFTTHPIAVPHADVRAV